MNSPATTGSDASGSTSKGIRPDIKLGANFPSASGEQSSGNGWDLSYTPGAKVLEVQVQVAIGSSVPSPGGLVMTIDEDGVNDMIAWLAGVKNAIAQANAAASKSEQSNSTANNTE